MTEHKKIFWKALVMAVIVGLVVYVAINWTLVFLGCTGSWCGIVASIAAIVTAILVFGLKIGKVLEYKG